ncbi:extracellular solute-binding protein [Marinactinospora rubrisoli]|uniref:Extracellular solute-binding protein n=1 Tax=Marinactinospora rubrisoli TaxID=2715399 RepID=A0ABW2KGW2_9ACTN
MSPRPPFPAPSRRRFLGLAGASTAAALSGGLLAGCAPDGPRPGTGSAAGVDRLDALIPDHIPFAGPAPDIPGVDGAPDGFTAYPDPLARALDGGSRGSGGHYRAMTPLWGPIPPGLGSNSHYALVNERMGATVEFNFQDGNTIIDKMNAVIAARDVADITMVPDWLINLIPQFGRAVGELFEDLTPYLAGNAVEPYPMLANLSSDAWKWGVFNERLQGIPLPAQPFSQWLFYRRDLFEQHDWPLPSTAEELFELGQEINDPDNNRWAFGDFSLVARQLFGAPREWRYENGELVHQFETPEFRATVEFMRRVFDAGLVHPDLVGGGGNSKELLKSGRTVIDQDGFGGWTEAYQDVLPENPDYRMDLLPAFGHDGGAPVLHRNDPSEHTVFIRKGLEPEQIEEILSVCDYCAAPFGTEEYVTYRYGAEGEHFEFDGDGAPQLTELGQREVSNGYLFISGRPPAITESQYPDYVESFTTWYNDAAQYAGPNPFEGIRIQRPTDYAGLETPTTDKVNDVIRGRRDVGALDTIVREWRRDGGDAAREFYLQVLQDNGRA